MRNNSSILDRESWMFRRHVVRWIRWFVINRTLLTRKTLFQVFARFNDPVFKIPGPSENTGIFGILAIEGAKTENPGKSENFYGKRPIVQSFLLNFGKLKIVTFLGEKSCFFYAARAIKTDVNVIRCNTEPIPLLTMSIKLWSFYSPKWDLCFYTFVNIVLDLSC